MDFVSDGYLFSIFDRAHFVAVLCQIAIGIIQFDHFVVISLLGGDLFPFKKEKNVVFVSVSLSNPYCAHPLICNMVTHSIFSLKCIIY